MKTCVSSVNRLRLLLGSLAVLLFSSMASADESAERLTHLLEPLTTYRANFDQQILDGSGQRLQEAKGTMWLSRPGKFRWEVEAPYRQQVVSDGNDVYFYDPDLEQVTVQPLDTRVTHTPALLLSGSVSELTQSYEVSRRQQGATETFTLRPRSADTLFEELRLTFHGERLKGLQMTDSTGQRTAIGFSDITVNPALEAPRFDFDIPQGVDVIRETHTAAP